LLAPGQGAFLVSAPYGESNPRGRHKPSGLCRAERRRRGAVERCRRQRGDSHRWLQVIIGSRPGSLFSCAPPGERQHKKALVKAVNLSRATMWWGWFTEAGEGANVYKDRANRRIMHLGEPTYFSNRAQTGGF